MKKMRSLSKVKLGLIGAAGAALVGVGLLQFAAAAGILKVQPSASSVENGSTVSVAIRIAPDQPVDGVDATVTYDQSKLEYVSLSSSGSAFPIELAGTGGSGTVQVTRGILGGTVSGDALVATVTFKALVGSGSTTVNISGNATSGGNYINPGFQNASLTLTSPPSSPPPSSSPPSSTPPSSTPPPTSGGSNPPSNSSGSQPSSSGNQTGSTPSPTVTGNGNCTDIKIENKQIELTRATLHTTLNNSCRVYVVFGTDKEQLKVSTAVSDLGTEHDVTLDPQLVVPGTTFYYKVVAEDEKGNKTESPVESFKTKGYTVRLLVKDSEGKPVKKRKIIIHSDPVTVETDNNGMATAENLAPGSHQVEYEQRGKVYSEVVSVADSPIADDADGIQTATPQDAEVVFKQLKFAALSPVVLPVSVAAGLVVLAGAAFLVMRGRQQNRFAPQMGTTNYDPFNTLPHQPAGPTTPNVHTSANPDDDLIQRVKGVDKPDPGSVVSPNRDDKDGR